MMKKLQQGMGATWIPSAVFLVLGAALFGSGFWLGQHSLTSPKRALVVPRPPGMAGQSLAGLPSPALTAPPGASPEMKEFLQNRALLSQKMEELRKQSPNGTPTPQEMAQFQQENADLIKRQSVLGQALSQQQAQNMLPMPPPLQIPPNATPQLKAFLTARDQLLRDQIAFENQHRTDAPDVRQAAIQQWRKDNDARFKELQQLSKALQPTPPAKVTATAATSASASSDK